MTASQVSEQSGIDGGGRGNEPLDGAGAVEADQGVEVDRASHLVLRNLGVLQRRDLTQPVGGHREGFASSRRSAMVNRRQRSGAHHCQTTCEA